ncbi:histone-fold-containing protein [Coniochaeta ligniaria NRRL 30616]|uniref:DNA polymerase epsilon subunit D n=1 Tax=Coniochaeta ligniaria NRRL 30616 TaxID=1408157 RepID=A0A1J7K4K4_9PEZI|nr:histone-fold-containing protein [Coniochaeta ligniaria NRRL 30616]
MPSRKSDVRRSDVSAVSRTNPADDEDSPMTTAAPAQADTASPVTGSLAPPEPSSETPQVEESNAGTSEKGKEKDKDRDRDAITIEDLNLPKSIITRLAKGVLPPNTQIQANAILALSKSATVFISHLSNAANEWTMSGGKKTIMPADVFRALDDIEYGFMREKLEAEFAKFNEIQSSKRSAYRKKVSAAKKARTGGEGAGDSSVLSTGTGAGGDESMLADTTVGTSAEAGGEGRAAKKAKVDAAGGKMEADGDGEVSDAETVPDEHVDEDDDEEEDEEDEEEDDVDEDEGGPGGEDDELEERQGREVEDEALDEDSE